MPAATPLFVQQEVAALARALYPGARAVSICPLRPDEIGGSNDGETCKAMGYSEPLHVRIVDRKDVAHELVLHTATTNEFGHDRRADRADEMILAWDTFRGVPGHARAIDVGAINADGSLNSLRDAEDFYLITEWIPGRLYAEDLRRVGRSGEVTAEDLARADALAHWAAALHATPPKDLPASAECVWRRAVRDLVGHGECIFGLSDGFADDVPAAPRARLDAIERRCLEWRLRLRPRAHRLRATHGDFHPFNIVFQEHTAFRLLDASRGSHGDPADDVAALCINFPFFALEHPGAWERGLGRLYHRFLGTYQSARPDDELYEVIAPFLAFRALVVCNPRFYPGLAPGDRDRLLHFVEQALDAERFEPDTADALFAPRH